MGAELLFQGLFYGISGSLDSELLQTSLSMLQVASAIHQLLQAHFSLHAMSRDSVYIQ